MTSGVEKEEEEDGERREERGGGGEGGGGGCPRRGRSPRRVVDNLLGLGRGDALPVDLVILGLVVQVAAEEREEEEDKQERGVVHPDQVVILDVAGAGGGFLFPFEPAE
jgi:hypothetical protein